MSEQIIDWYNQHMNIYNQQSKIILSLNVKVNANFLSLVAEWAAILAYSTVIQVWGISRIS